MAAITWLGTTSTDWELAANWSSVTTIPTAADDVTFTSVTNNPCTITSGHSVVCRSISFTGGTGYTSTFTGTSATLSIGDASGGAATFSSGMTLTGGRYTFVSTSNNGGTGWGITTNGKTIPGLTFSGNGGKWVLQDNLTCAADITQTRGTLDTNGKTVSCTVFTCSGTLTRTLTLGASSISCTAGGQSWDTSGTGLTFNANTSTVNLTNGFPNANFGTQTFNNVVIGTLSGGSPSGNINGAATFANLTINGGAATTCSITVSASMTVTGTLTFSGNSAANRLYIGSQTRGTARTFTCTNAPSITNVDFQDITAAGAGGTWSGTVLGNAGGNTNITFTTPVTRYAVVAGNYSATATWSASDGGAGGASVPLPQDTVIFNGNAAAGTYTFNEPRLGTDVDFTGFTRTASFASIVTEMYGSLTFGTAGTYSGTQVLTLAGRSSHTITCGATKFPPMNVVQDSIGGTYTLGATYTANGSSGYTLTNGTFNTNNFNMGVSFFGSNNSNTRSITLGTSTITIQTGPTFAVWNLATTTNLTFSGASSTIIIQCSTGTAASATGYTFAGGGKTYGTLTCTYTNLPASVSPLNITGANTFTTLNVGSGRSLVLPASTTNTVTTFNATGANNGYVYFPGIASNYMTTPDSAALSITGDIDIRVRIAMDDWTPAAASDVITKSTSTSNQRSWQFIVNTDGTLGFGWSTDGTGFTKSATSTVATGFTDGTAHWIRMTLDVDNGAAGSDAKFYTAADNASMPSSWTQLGSTVTGVGTTSIFDSTAPVVLGLINADVAGGTLFTAGKYYRAQIRNNIADDGTGIQYDADLSTKAFGANSFTESSSNAATVTITGAVIQSGDGRIALTSSSGGSAATLSSANKVKSDYLTVQDNTAAGNIPFFAGANSKLVSNTTNWLAQYAPANFTLLGVG